MTTSIGSQVDKFRHLIRQATDDTPFSDEFLYVILKDSRDILVYREISKRKFRSKFNYKTVCIPLELAKDIPCDCIPERVGCYVLKSKFELPKPVKGPTGEMISVTTIDGKQEFSFKEVRVGKYNKYSRLKERPYYTIYNNYLYIVGYPKNSLKAVMISMIPEDPTDFDQVHICDETGQSVETCFNPLEDTFNIDGYLIGAMIDMSLQKLGITLSIPEHVSNDANPSPKELQY